MPDMDKYTLLLQSYASSIREMSGGNLNATLMGTMETLFVEMLQRGLNPTPDHARSLVDGASAFCSGPRMATAMRLTKAGGLLRAFGVGVGSLTTPITSVEGLAILSSTPIPYDNREEEMAYAGVVALSLASWGVLELTSKINGDAAPWATLLGCFAVLLGFADVAARKGKGLRLAAAGIERMTLRDIERDQHCDSAAFLAGYLLGLPSFCFRPDVTEALKMLTEPDSERVLNAFKQPLAAIKMANKQNQLESLFGFIKPSSISTSSSSSSLSSPSSPSSSSTSSSSSLSTFLLPLEKLSGTPESKLFDLGRVLIWLFAPVAAENMKFGRTVVSDPRRSDRLLGLLESVQAKETPSGSMDDLPIPKTKEDKEAFVQVNFVLIPTIS